MTVPHHIDDKKVVNSGITENLLGTKSNYHAWSYGAKSVAPFELNGCGTLRTGHRGGRDSSDLRPAQSRQTGGLQQTVSKYNAFAAIRSRPREVKVSVIPGMKYQLVLQFRGDSLEDYDAMVALGDALIEALQDSAKLTATTSVPPKRTSSFSRWIDPHKTSERAKPVLEKKGVSRQRTSYDLK